MNTTLENIINDDSHLNIVQDNWGYEESELRQIIFFQFIDNIQGQEDVLVTISSEHDSGCVLLDNSNRCRDSIWNQGQSISPKE